METENIPFVRIYKNRFVGIKPGDKVVFLGRGRGNTFYNPCTEINEMYPHRMMDFSSKKLWLGIDTPY